MPTFGVESTGGTAYTFENTVVARPAAPTSDGSATNISAYLKESSTNNTHTVKCTLYTSDGNRIEDSQNQLQDLTTSYAWKNFAININVTASTTYLITAWTGGGAGTCDLAYDAGTSSDGKYNDSVSYATNWPASISFGNLSAILSIHCDYSSGKATRNTRSFPLGINVGIARGVNG